MKSHTSRLYSFWGSVGIQCPCLQIWRLSTNRYFVFSTASFVSFDIRADALTSIGGRMHHSCSQYTSSHPNANLVDLGTLSSVWYPIEYNAHLSDSAHTSRHSIYFPSSLGVFFCKYTPLYIYCIDNNSFRLFVQYLHPETQWIRQLLLSGRVMGVIVVCLCQNT